MGGVRFASERVGRAGDGGLDDGVGAIFGASVVDVEALVDGCLGEGDGIGGCGVYALAGRGGAERGELAHDGDERRRERLQAEVGEPEAQVELIGHMLIVAVRHGVKFRVWGPIETVETSGAGE